MFRHSALGDVTFRPAQDNEAMQDGKDAKNFDKHTSPAHDARWYDK